MTNHRETPERLGLSDRILFGLGASAGELQGTLRFGKVSCLLLLTRALEQCRGGGFRVGVSRR